MHAKSCHPLEEHARNLLTPFAFNAFQQELVVAMQYAMSEMSNGSYLIHHFKKIDIDRCVVFIPGEEHIHCSCKEFESSGILCRHAVRVLMGKNYFLFPDKYLPRRWRQESSLLYNDHATQNNDDGWFQEYQSLTETLFSESLLTRERYDYARAELIKGVKKLLDEVRNMPESDGIAMDSTLSPTA